MNYEQTWKPVKGYEGLYECSNYGDVKSLERLDNRGRHLKEKLLKPQKNSKGYLYVDLYKNGVGNHFRINRLIYETFVGEIPPKWDVNHLDENKENNRVENLEACSHGDNVRWGTGIARSTAAQKNDSKKSKAIEALDKINGRVVFTFPSTREAGRQGFNQGAISTCCRNCFNRPGNNIYKGFIWRYKDDI